MEKKQKYTDAIKELENIIAEIENEEISVDILGEKVKRASELIKFCRDKLFKTEEEINDILKDLKQGQE
jgi:exodeoxyribonuclease VII small subunit